MGGSAVQRPVKFVKYLQNYGWKPFVITCKDDYSLQDVSLCDDIPSSVEVKYVNSFEPAYLLSSVKKKYGSTHIWGPILQFIIKIYSIIYCRIAFPDWAAGWIPFGYRQAIKNLRRIKFDVIYVHSQPASSFVIGYWLKKRTGIPLVLDYDDPWTTSLHQYQYYREKSIMNKLGRWLENRILKKADSVIYCKNKVYEGIKETFPHIDTGKFVLIPNGYDPEDFSCAPEKKDTGKFRFVYTGKISRKFCYSPASLFAALRILLNENKISSETVELIVAGSADNEHMRMAKDLQLDAIVHFEGYINHKKSIEYLKSADACVLIIESVLGTEISNTYAGSVPAKLFEYLYTGKPILAIVPSGEETELIKKTNLGYFAHPNNIESVKKAFEEILDGHYGKNVKSHAPREFILSFDRHELTAQLVRQFVGVSGKSK
jgi:glycosyltransferase involved in cell wall biosynthesis